MPAKGPNKSKRDEWSVEGVLTLLEVYEAKWLLRNRAKFKGSDWEDIAHQVSVQSSGIKGLKAPNQCKNKIESMKKRYRAEAASCTPLKPCSSWQFYTQMDRMLKGAPHYSNQPKIDNNINLQDLPKSEPDVEVDEQVQCSNHDDGSNTMPMDLNANNDKNNEEVKQAGGTDSNVSADKPAKRRKGSGGEVAESIQLLAHSIQKIEEARMEMYKDLERMRAETEIKRGEMELKRTEIVAKSQLQIAKLFVRRSQDRKGKSNCSSSEDGMTVLARREGMVSHITCSFLNLILHAHMFLTLTMVVLRALL